MPKTQYLAAYDITDDDLRKAIADLLKNNGLERIQYSVFYGNLTRNEAEEIGIKFKEITLGHKAQLLLMSICELCAKKQLVITNEGDCPHNDDTEKKEEQEDNENKNKPRQNEENKEKQENKENDEGKESPEKETKNKKQEKTEKQPKTRSKKKKPTTIPLDELKEQKKQRIIFF